ncbi:hypothetical protein PT276_03320 [Orbaceae bacterium ESL0721]|nr:hypothetical protein [Orbaceae bacterium ESL0721]
MEAKFSQLHAPTAEFEAALIAHIGAKFGQALPVVTTLESVKSIQDQVDGAYVTFIKSRHSELPNCCRQKWAVFMALKRESTEMKLLQDYLIAILHNQQFQPAKRAMQFLRSVNLTGEQATQQGRLLYGHYFTIDMPIISAVPEGSIDDFITYYHQWNQTPKWESFNTLSGQTNEQKRK